jgi:hypothetical protein
MIWMGSAKENSTSLYQQEANHGDLVDRDLSHGQQASSVEVRRCPKDVETRSMAREWSNYSSRTLIRTSLTRRVVNSPITHEARRTTQLNQVPEYNDQRLYRFGLGPLTFAIELGCSRYKDRPIHCSAFALTGLRCYRCMAPAVPSAAIRHPRAALRAAHHWSRSMTADCA